MPIIRLIPPLTFIKCSTFQSMSSPMWSGFVLPALQQRLELHNKCRYLQCLEALMYLFIPCLSEAKI